MRKRVAVTVGAMAIIATAASIELAMGRAPWCECGYVRFWHGVTLKIAAHHRYVLASSTASCSTLLWLAADAFPRASIIAAVPGAWRSRNTPFVINRYRAATISLDYYGDSVINSMSDVVAMMAGFWIAERRLVQSGVIVLRSPSPSSFAITDAQYPDADPSCRGHQAMAGRRLTFQRQTDHPHHGSGACAMQAGIRAPSTRSTRN
jgi:hypothetical protein